MADVASPEPPLVLPIPTCFTVIPLSIPLVGSSLGGEMCPEWSQGTQLFPQVCLTWQGSGLRAPKPRLLFLPTQWLQLKPSLRGRQRGACKGGELGMRSAGWMGQAMAAKASGLQQSRR